MHRVLESNQSQCLKLYAELNTHKIIKAEKHGDNAGKLLHKLMNNAEYGIIIENLRNRINVRLVSKKKDQLVKMQIKNQATSQKIFDNDLFSIRKSKITLTFKKIDSFLVDDCGQHKEAKGVNKNVVETISHR